MGLGVRVPCNSSQVHYDYILYMNNKTAIELGGQDRMHSYAQDLRMYFIRVDRGSVSEPL